MNWVLRVGGSELVFGHHTEAVSLVHAPTVSVGDIRGDVFDLPQSDGLSFGVDHMSGQNVLFELALRTDDEASVRALTEAVRRMWRADVVRGDAGAVAVLVSPDGRTAFGRPRRFAADFEWAADGRVDVTADFEATSDLWFGDELSSSVTLVPPPGGGVVAPVVAPVTTSVSSDRSSSFTVGGVVDTWPVFEVYGPVSRPAVEVVGLFRLEYAGSLAYDEVLTIDTNPHARSVTVNGAGVALSPASARLASASVPPGIHVLSLFGTSVSGTAAATVKWRNAFTNF